MPTLSMFFGIIIRMYYAPKEHNPPHIHCFYQDSIALINIINCDLMEGELPTKQLRFVIAWIEIHKEDLMADWSLAIEGLHTFKISPLL